MANINPIKAPSAAQKANTVWSDPLPGQILPLCSEQINNKLTSTATGSFSPQLQFKASQYVPIGGKGIEEDFAAKMLQMREQEDEGGVKEYVDMQCL